MSRCKFPIFLLVFIVMGFIVIFSVTAGAEGPVIALEADDAVRGEDAKGPLFLAQEPDGQALEVPGNQSPGGGPTLVEHEGQAGPEEEFPDGPAEIPSDQEGLYREVRELRDIVDRLRKEAEARDRLRVTSDEERDKQAEILEAAGREYSLSPVWVFNMDLNAQYSYNAYDVIRFIDLQEGRQVEYHSNHTIVNSLSLTSGVRDNLAIGATIPFIYKYDQVGTAQSLEATNLGDISLNMQYQPFRSGQGYPSPIFSFSYTMPTGKSPFDINTQTELSTGSGLTNMSGGLSLSHPFDPVSVYGSISYSKSLKEENIGQMRLGAPGILDKVDPGASIGGSLGFGYSVSYRMSLTFSLMYNYYFSSDYYWIVKQEDYTVGARKTSSGDSVSATLGIGTAWRVSPGRTIILSIGKGLTTANPGFSISVRLPVAFDWRER